MGGKPETVFFFFFGLSYRVEEMTQDKMTMVTKMEERAAQLQLQLDVQKDAYKVKIIFSFTIHVSVNHNTHGCAHRVNNTTIPYYSITKVLQE